MSKSVIVIGGGVIGLSCAYYAARRGCVVTVLDPTPNGRNSCAYGSAGMVVPSHFVPLAAPGMIWTALRMMCNPRSPFFIKPTLNPEMIRWGLAFARASSEENVRRSAPLLRDLSLASRKLFKELSTETGNPFSLVEKGLLMLCSTRKGFAHESATATQAKDLGLEAEVLSSSELQTLEPTLRTNVEGAVYFPQDAHLDPGHFLRQLEIECLNLGVTFHHFSGRPVYQKDGRGITAIQAGEQLMEADEYVLCCGSWSTREAASLGIDMPMQPGKGYSLTIHKPAQLPRHCAILTEARVAVTPIQESLRFAGTMEFDGFNDQINPKRIEGIIRSVPRYLPAFEEGHFEFARPWSGFRPVTPDGLPYIGRVRRYENLLVATGHAMMGLSLAPVTGSLISDIVLGSPPAIEISALDPERFSKTKAKG